MSEVTARYLAVISEMTISAQKHIISEHKHIIADQKPTKNTGDKSESTEKVLFANGVACPCGTNGVVKQKVLAFRRFKEMRF